MKVITKNILSNDLMKESDAICFTSNGVIKNNGRLVMGAGVAKLFRDAFRNIDKEAGLLCKKNGNICQIVKSIKFLGTSLHIIAFPTKQHWRDKSTVYLINQSALRLVDLANKHGWKQVVLPAPGVGLGGLDFNKEVKPLLEMVFDDRFVITFRP